MGKTSPQSGPDNMASVSRQIEWRMSPSVCTLYHNIDLKSELGLSMNKAMMEYERACAEAKVALIVKLTELLAKTEKL
jgi:hypothetical protein